MTSSRHTKYVDAVIAALARLGHATNAELHAAVKGEYPEVSATTIHRVTTRLKERGRIGCAPKPLTGAERYDINPEPHHHFVCQSCGGVCDIADTVEARAVMEQLKTLSGHCELAGSLTMQGECKGCVKGGHDE